MIINQRMKRVGVGCLALIAIGVVFNRFDSKEVKMVEVRRQLLQDYLEMPGQVDVLEKETVCSQYEGVITKLHITEGQMVAAAEELLRLRLADYPGSLEKADAAYQAAQTKVASLTKKMGSAQVKRAELQLMQAQAIAEQTRRHYEEVRAQLEQTRQSAAGTVTAVGLKEKEDRLKLAEAAMTEATRQAENAGRDFKLLKKALTPRELRDAEAELQRLGAQVTQIRQNEGEVGVLAPLGGSVLKKYIAVGAQVRAGERLLELGNFHTAYLRATAPAGEQAKIGAGQKVMVSGAGLRENIISGTVIAARSGKAGQQPAAATPEQAQVHVKYDNERVILKYGARLKLKLILQEAENALAIPATAVFKRFGKPYVYVVEDSKAILRPVRTGIANSGLIEIKKGLFAGEQVIESPGLDLQSGMKVTAGEEL
jgi:RND family efflux transporter MFP subunit